MRCFKKMTLALAVAAAAAAFIGCGNSTQGSSGQTTAPEQGTSSQEQQTAGSGEAAKPASIRWMVHSGLNEENGTAQWAEEYERLTGIRMDLDIVSNNEYSTILELAFASGTVPDVFDLTGDNLAVYASQGAVADLTDLVKNSDFYDRVDPALFEAITLNGKIYGVPWEIPSGGVTYVRKDWLDRLGMEIPTTYDEFIAMLEAFKTEIPECRVPFTAPGLKASMNLAEFYQGATPEFTKVNGVWVDGMSQDNMAQGLANLRDAYSRGLLDTEVVTNTTSNCRDQWYSGSVGAFNYWGGQWGKTLTERLLVNVPDAEVVAIPPIEGAVYELRTPSIMCISSALSQDQIASIFQYFMEYMHDGGEGQVLFESGVEGLHWEQQGDKVKPLPSPSNKDELMQKAWITPWLAIAPLTVTDKKLDLDASVTDSLAVINTYGTQKSVYPVSPTLTKIKADLEMLKQEVIAKVIMGDMTVEEGVAKYKSESEILNVNKVVEEMNQ